MLQSLSQTFHHLIIVALTLSATISWLHIKLNGTLGSTDIQEENPVAPQSNPQSLPVQAYLLMSGATLIASILGLLMNMPITAFMGFSACLTGLGIYLYHPRLKPDGQSRLKHYSSKGYNWLMMGASGFGLLAGFFRL